LEAITHDNQNKTKHIEDLDLKVTELQEMIKNYEVKQREDEMLRRKLHNTIQELKGNIRVFCRVKPIISKDVGDSTIPFSFPADEKTLEVTTPSEKSSITGKEKNKKLLFNFDKVFPPGSNQECVFNEVSQLVQSALDGYHTSIFTYGQTGSGKTYTMEGPGVDSGDDNSRGVIPRAVEQIFASAHKLEEMGWMFEYEADYLEIYNESIRDLLTVSSKEKKEELKIVHGDNLHISIPGLTTIKVIKPSQVYDLLKRASKNRAVGETKMNARSSRSHSVFQLHLTGHNKITDERVNGLLNLIDLAGSERLDQSGATGDRLTETKKINTSLSTLTFVIGALVNKDSYIPYRNSKLTDLLQNSLGGNSKTLMFVNISPLEKDLPETLSSLRFAIKVNACDIGVAKKQGKIDFKN